MEILSSMKLQYSITVFIIILLTACSNDNNSDTGKKQVYVSPYIDYKGNFHNGHLRMPLSTNKNAIKNENRSRYYYQTIGKYRRKK